MFRTDYLTRKKKKRRTIMDYHTLSKGLEHYECQSWKARFNRPGVNEDKDLNLRPCTE